MKFRTSGGGFLNGVVGTITGTKFDTKEWEDKKGEPYHTLSIELQVLQEGADEPVSQFIKAGFFYPDEQTISKDGTTITSDKPTVAGDSDAAKFLQSLVAGGFPEDKIDDDVLTLQSIVGTKVKFKKVVDMEATKLFGKRKGKLKDGTKAEFNRDYLAVEAVLELGSGKAAKKGVKVAPKVGKAVAPKAPAASEGVDTDAGDTVLLALLKAATKKGNDSIEKKAIASLVTRYFMQNDGLNEEDRDPMWKLLTSDAYLSDAVERGIITWDSESKTQAISAA